MEGTEAQSSSHGSPCKYCGKEAGITNKGRRRKVCDDCKNANTKARNVRRVEIGCHECGKPFMASSRSAKYCVDCRNAMFAAKQVSCRNCGITFRKSDQGGNSRGLFCTNKCAGQYRSRRNGTRLRKLLQSVLSEMDCRMVKLMAAFRAERKSIEARFAKAIAEECAECLDCGKSLEISESKYWKVPKYCCDCLRKRSRKPGNRKHTARAGKKGLPKSYAVTIDKVGERDNWMCQLCEKPIEDRSDRQGPMSPCIDHIVPINHEHNNKHGHTMDNVQIAHRVCNERKGCSVAHESLLSCASPREHLVESGIDQATSMHPHTGVGSNTILTFRPESHAPSARVSVGFPKK